MGSAVVTPSAAIGNVRRLAAAGRPGRVGRPDRPSTSAPARIAELADFYAAEAARGQYPWARLADERRWHQRIYRDQQVDVWLISWLPTQGTLLHDHGGSSGAFAVVSGTLTESVPAGFGDGRVRIRDTERAAGERVRFGRHYIHDLRNAGSEPALSVHAYSAPLTSMTYYEIADGDLAAVSTVFGDDPEVELRIAS